MLLSTYGSRGDVEPLAGLAARLRELGAEVRVCAPPDEVFAQRLAAVGVPLVPVGPSARALTNAAPPPSSLPRRAAELIAGQLDAVPPAAEGCDVLVATGVLPAAAGALSVAELGVGVAHDGPTPTFASLSAALRDALAPETRARATAVAGRVRADGASVAARLLLDSGS
ncbi:glycosyltransferase [Streptomyces musisoli]|uniref:glycosyltransferase n=1 Tax=Streptomyces musisoli TaxID=2802280 RepID=UPI0035587570